MRRIEGWNIISSNTFLDYQHRFYRAKIHRKLQEYHSADSVLNELVIVLSNHAKPELIELNIQALQEQGDLVLLCHVWTLKPVVVPFETSLGIHTDGEE